MNEKKETKQNKKGHLTLSFKLFPKIKHRHSAIRAPNPVQHLWTIGINQLLHFCLQEALEEGNLYDSECMVSMMLRILPEYCSICSNIKRRFLVFFVAYRVVQQLLNKGITRIRKDRPNMLVFWRLKSTMNVPSYTWKLTKYFYIGSILVDITWWGNIDLFGDPISEEF